MSNIQWAGACALVAAVINYLVHGSFWAAILGAAPTTFLMSLGLFALLDYLDNRKKE